MDQSKIGNFLRELRKEKDLTQEELADRFNVSRRTVSRWETGTNLPDLDLLIELSDFYDVDLREILNGERQNREMDKELKETVLKVAEYSTGEKQKMARATLILFALGIAAVIINIAMRFLDLPDSRLVEFLDGATMGLPLGTMVIGILYVSGAMAKVRAFKQRLLGKHHEE